MPNRNPIRNALAEVTDAELRGLLTAARGAASHKTAQFAPSLLTYIAHTCDWEQQRRRGKECSLQRPCDGIGDDECAFALTMLAAITLNFGANPKVRVLLAAIGDGLCAPPSTLH